MLMQMSKYEKMLALYYMAQCLRHGLLFYVRVANDYEIVIGKIGYYQ